MIKILNKVNNAKVLINIVVLILIYFFSFNLYPNLGFYNKLEYKGIKTEAFNFFSNNHNKYSNVEIVLHEEPEFLEEQDLFLKKYFSYLTKNKDLVSNAPCPKELLVNNLRNIQIYNDSILDSFQAELKFNVRFSFYKFFSSSEKLNINKCFDYIFKENLNKFFILYRDALIKKLQYKINDLNKINFDVEQVNVGIEINKKILEKLKSFNFFIDPNTNYLRNKTIKVFQKS